MSKHPRPRCYTTFLVSLAFTNFLGEKAPKMLKLGVFNCQIGRGGDVNKSDTCIMWRPFSDKTPISRRPSPVISTFRSANTGSGKQSLSARTKSPSWQAVAAFDSSNESRPSDCPCSPHLSNARCDVHLYTSNSCSRQANSCMASSLVVRARGGLGRLVFARWVGWSAGQVGHHVKCWSWSINLDLTF